MPSALEAEKKTHQVEVEALNSRIRKLEKSMKDRDEAEEEALPVQLPRWVPPQGSEWGLLKLEKTK